MAETSTIDKTAQDSKELAHVCNPAGLRSDQLQAITLLVEGKTGREVAGILGVMEGTISRWRTSDDAFIAEFTRQRALIYESGLQRAYSRIDAQLDDDDKKIVQGAAKTRLEHHAQLQRANSTVTHTVILDKLQAALQGQDTQALDAEYRELAAGVDTPPTEATDD